MNKPELHLDKNPDWKKLPSPKTGDIVHFKDTRDLGHLFKGIVSFASPTTVSARIDAVFTLDGSAEIELGEATRFVEKDFAAHPSYIWQVIES